MRPIKSFLSLTLLLLVVSFVSAHPADKLDVKVKIEVAYTPQVVLQSVDAAMLESGSVFSYDISGAHGFAPFVVVVGGEYFLPAPDYPYTLHNVLADNFHLQKYNRIGRVGFIVKLPQKIFYKGDSRCAS